MVCLGVALNETANRAFEFAFMKRGLIHDFFQTSKGQTKLPQSRVLIVFQHIPRTAGDASRTFHLQHHTVGTASYSPRSVLHCLPPPCIPPILTSLFCSITNRHLRYSNIVRLAIGTHLFNDIALDRTPLWPKKKVITVERLTSPAVIYAR